MKAKSKLRTILNQIDEINKKDVHQEEFAGQLFPKEHLYSLRMTEMLFEYDEDPPEELQIVARGQHIKRWAIKREDFPNDRKGYLKWRSRLTLFHAEQITNLLQESGYDEVMTARIADIISKKYLKTDRLTQQLEDLACLVFLKWYFEDFRKKHDEEKVINILRKTWSKMTEKGKDMALELPLSTEVKVLVERVLGL